MFDDLRQDVHYTLRTLRRQPGFAAVVIVTLAIGIGANTAIFGLLETVLLRELPVKDPQQLVLVRTAGPGGRSNAPPYPYFNRMRNQIPSLAGAAAFATDVHDRRSDPSRVRRAGTWTPGGRDAADHARRRDDHQRSGAMVQRGRAPAL